MEVSANSDPISSIVNGSAAAGTKALPTAENSDKILLEILGRLDHLIHLHERVIDHRKLPAPPPPQPAGGGRGGKSSSSSSSVKPLAGLLLKRDVEKGVLTTGETLKKQKKSSLLPFRNYEIGKLILIVVSPITAYLLGLNNSASSTDLLESVSVYALLFGVTLIWNGYVLAHPLSGYARVLEELGVILVILSFFCFLASRLSSDLTLVLVVCFLLCVKPLVLLRWAERFFPPPPPPPPGGDDV
ncbi:hypothetical protein BVC80_9011g52 [Macleaya cordata]|uniref:Uncharacterized protein n=1 Tax=Macleaya cordata TaxID=56857 RepID=A0A200QPZ7_MACCD|nr:hypothetical protein BVC80_9011g52 [Macleaya cordata]